jgi:hypothetical protein
MDPVRQERRTGIISMIAALVVVCVFWAFFFIQHSKQPTPHKGDAELIVALKGIEPPADVKTISIDTLHVEKVSFAKGVYLTHSDFEKIRAAYMKEFVRHGFVYKPWNNSKTLYFCSDDFYAVVGEPTDGLFDIFLTWKNNQCL